MNAVNSQIETAAPNRKRTVDEWVEALTDWVAEQDRSGTEVCLDRPGRRTEAGRHAWAWLVGEGYVVRDVVDGLGGHSAHVWRLT
jgi:hypothetical protein